MVLTKPRFASFEDYLAADPSSLPESKFEYWDGELVSVMPESIGNDSIANFVFVLLVGMGLPIHLLRPGKIEVEVIGRPRTRIPDFLALEEDHLTLLHRRATINLSC